MEEFDETKLQIEQKEGRLRDSIVISRDVEQIAGKHWVRSWEAGTDFSKVGGDGLWPDEDDSNDDDDDI